MTRIVFIQGLIVHLGPAMLTQVKVVRYLNRPVKRIGLEESLGGVRLRLGMVYSNLAVFVLNVHLSYL